jgi:outer membrane protein OmpA-like peptidoglycan-associated protein
LEAEKALEAKNIELQNELDKIKVQESKALDEAKAEVERLKNEKLELEKAHEAAKLATERVKKEAEAERVAAQKAKEEAAEKAKQLAEEKAIATAKKVEMAKEAIKSLTEAFSLAKVKFETGSSLLTKDSKERLQETANVMKRYTGYHYEIQGHTDSRGREEFNVELSGKRASAVKDYLEEEGIDASVLVAKGFGSEKPIADNETKEGREKNRRVVFEIIQ